jgi:hypothetical protein
MATIGTWRCLSRDRRRWSASVATLAAPNGPFDADDTAKMIPVRREPQRGSATLDNVTTVRTRPAVALGAT